MSDTIYYPKQLPEDDGVIDVTIQRVPRWKESDLSGDEWRYTLTGVIHHKNWSDGGTTQVVIGGYSLIDIGIRVGAWLNEHRSRRELTPPGAIRELTELVICFQPGCDTSPENIYAIKQEWTWFPHQGRRMESPSSGPSVRAFCARHSHRGDCDLEDQDDNYDLLAYLPMAAMDSRVSS